MLTLKLTGLTHGLTVLGFGLVHSGLGKSLHSILLQHPSLFEVGTGNWQAEHSWFGGQTEEIRMYRCIDRYRQIAIAQMRELYFI